jgi:hypothetical protein
MAAEKIVQNLAGRIARRQFLSRAGMSVVGGLAAIMGLPRATEAGFCPSPLYQYSCCCLCGAPTGCSGSACTWCWSCRTSAGRTRYCCECYYPCGSACDGSCNCHAGSYSYLV